MSKSAKKAALKESAETPQQEQVADATEENEEEGEETASFQEIDKLQNLGINAADIQKLKSGGVHTIEGIMMRTKKELCNIKGFRIYNRR